MTSRITISVPGSLIKRIAESDMRGDISRICREALERELERRQVPRHERMWKERLALVRQGTTAA